MPQPSPTSAVNGTYQSDLIIRTAIMTALAEARSNPDLLDYIFHSLPLDPLTSVQYGQKDVDQAKRWFLKTDIPVALDLRLDKATWPLITISMLDSVETEQTLGDVHYVPYEGTFADWPIIAGPFTPTSYSPSSGMMLIPDSAIAGLVLDGGMVLIDAAGRQFPVQQVLDTNLIAIAPGVLADFRTVMIKDGNPGLITPIESTRCRESYQVGLYVSGESIHLIYLHSIIVFMLNRRKQDLFEGRGMERTTMSSTKVERFTPTDNEVVFGRSINIVSYVMNTWIKDNKQVIQGIGIGYPDAGLTVGVEGSSGPGLNDSGHPPTANDSWTVDEDAAAIIAGEELL